MKKTIKNIALLLFTGIIFTACDNDDATGDSIIDYSSVEVTLSSTMNNTVIDESLIDPDDLPVVTLTATIAEPNPLSLRVPIVIANSSTADADDFIMAELIIPALQTSATIEIEIAKNGYVEGNETLVLTGVDAAGMTVTPFELTIDIENDYINDVLDLTLSWDGEFENGDLTLTSICAIDYDIVLANSAGAIVSYIAGTADCPEVGSISGLADGTYYILADMYENPYSGDGFTDTIPLTLEYSQEYFTTSGVITNANHTLGTVQSTHDAVGNSAFDAAAGIAIIEVSGYNYTVTSL
ncbi:MULTISPECIES: hypothetical protein [unclassified Lacinutrix]